MDTSIPCRYFNSPGGCNFGNQCTFSHGTAKQGGVGAYKGKNNTNNQFQSKQPKQHYANNSNPKKHEDGASESHWDIPDNCPIQGISPHDKGWYWKQESAHVLNDMDPGPKWLFSCYAQDDGTENVTYEGNLVFADYCPEELAWETINAARNNKLDEFEAQFNAIASEYISKKESIIANCKDNLTQTYSLRGTGQNKALKAQHNQARFGAKTGNNNINNSNNNSNHNPNYKGGNPNPNYKGNNPNPNYKGNNQNNQNNQNTNPNYKGKGNKNFTYKNKSNNKSMGDCPW